MRRVLRPLVIVVASSTSMGLNALASDSHSQNLGSLVGQLGEQIAHVAADQQYCAVPFATCTTPAPGMAQGRPHAAAQLGSRKLLHHEVNIPKTLANVVSASDGSTLLLAETLRKWEEASKLSEPKSDRVPRQFVKLLRPLHSGHEISALLELRGVIRVETLKARYTWKIERREDETIVLSAVPNDLTERLFVPRLEVALDRNTYRPISIAFEARKSTGPHLARRVEVALDRQTAMPIGSEIRPVSGGRAVAHRVARPIDSGVILASSTREAAVTRGKPRLLNSDTPLVMKNLNREPRLRQILEQWADANRRRTPSVQSLAIDPQLPAQGVRHAAVTIQERPLDLARCSGSELNAQYEWRLLYEADDYIWLTATVKTNAKQSIQGMTVILKKESWMPVCEHRRLANGQTETVQSAEFSENEKTAATSRPRLLPPAPRE